MTREDILTNALQRIDSYRCLLLQLATGTGKSKIAIELINHLCDVNYKNTGEETTVLILVPKTVLKEEWKKEINKWGGLKTDCVKIECYNSLHKYKGSTWDVVILDEVQHLSEARISYLNSMCVTKIIGLSATIPLTIKDYFRRRYNTNIIKVNIEKAIEDNILPEPTVYLMPLTFDTLESEVIVLNKNKSKKIIEGTYRDLWHYKKRKDMEIHIKCNKYQYLEYLDGEIEFFKKLVLGGNESLKGRWMQLCVKRLQWLAEKKNPLILSILDKLKNYRTITFCGSIDQANQLGSHCIHSKNASRDEVYKAFNDKKIKHITTVHILNEGANLSDCRYGIFANINASDIIVPQRIGRALRHKNPVIIVPYYKNSREEELVKKHFANYNRKLLRIISNINEIEV